MDLAGWDNYGGYAVMSERDSSSLTIVGGRPNKEGKEPSGISPGLQALLQRLAENPSLAHDLVADPEGTLVAEGLTHGLRPLR